MSGALNRASIRTALFSLVPLGSLVAIGLLTASPPADDAPDAADWRRRLREQVETRARRGLLFGPDDWLFLGDEATLLLADRLPEPSPPVAPTDPVAVREAVVGFRDQLAERGIDLLFVPVPPKLGVYPERYLGGELVEDLPRLDTAVVRLLSELSASGIATVDLMPTFLAQRRVGGGRLYTATDSHWSSRGCELAAAEVARAARELEGDRLPAPRPGFRADVTSRSIELTGDIAAPLPRRGRTREAIELREVSPAREATVDAGSPLLLIGDSHLLIWDDRESGFRDHLERALGWPVERCANEAGGPTGARQALRRRLDRLDGKRLVIWLTGARTLVNGRAWRPVPLEDD